MRWKRSAAAACLAVAAACGGGEDGRSTGSTFGGTFKASGLSGTFNTAPDVVASFGTARPTAGFVFDLDLDENENGTVTDLAATTAEFALLGDGTLKVGSGGSEFLRGQVALDGRIALLASVHTGEDPSFLALVRCWAGIASDAELDGTYHVITFREAGTSMSSAVGLASLDGAGLGSIEAGATLNTDGAIATTAAATPFAYHVAADGTTTLNAGGPATFEGGLLEGGGFALLSGATTTAGEPQLIAFLRSAAGASDLTLTGTYAMVGMTYDAPAFSFRSFTGTAAADGTGSVAVEGVQNDEGTIVEPSPGTLTYAVSPDGTVTVDTPDGTLRGAVSADGRIAILGGGVSPGSTPSFYLFVRR